MKKKRKILKYAGAIIVLLIVAALFFPTWTKEVKGKNSISVLEQVEINGTKQQLLIRGQDQQNPIVLYVHGGPGCPETPYAAAYQDLLEKDFTVVQYDQRGSGKSYHFNEDYSDLTTDLLTEDLLELTDYLSKRFDQEKILLVGHSFGSYVAAKAAYKAPEKYAAYVGIGQASNMQESEIDIFDQTLRDAKKAGNKEDVKQLNALRNKIHHGETIVPRDYVTKYGGVSRLIDVPDGDAWGILTSREYNLLDFIRYQKGLIMSQELLVKETFDYPLPKLVPKLDTPFYFVMGKYDGMTSVQAAKHYYDQMAGKKKEFVVFEDSAHYPQFEEKEAFYKWMTDTFKE